MRPHIASLAPTAIDSGWLLNNASCQVKDKKVRERESTTESQRISEENSTMLRLAAFFLVIAMIAAFFGYGGVANYSYEGAKLFVFVFVILAVLAFLGGRFRKSTI